MGDLWSRMVDAGDMALLRAELGGVLFGWELFEVGLVGALEEAWGFGDVEVAYAAALLLSLKDSVE